MLTEFIFVENYSNNSNNIDLGPMNYIIEKPKCKAIFGLDILAFNNKHVDSVTRYFISIAEINNEKSLVKSTDAPPENVSAALMSI